MHIPTTGRTPVVWTVLAGLVAASTYLTGVYHGQQRGIQLLQSEAAGNLTQRLEALSLLRMGDTVGAVARLEDEADQLAVSIATNPSADRRVLISAKAYRSVVPPSPARRDELTALFATVPAPQPVDCNSALRRFVFGADGGSR